MSDKRIYAGMIDKGVEIFKDKKGGLYCSHDWRIHQWPDFPKYVKGKIETEMLNDPVALSELAKMDGLTFLFLSSPNVLGKIRPLMYSPIM